jgi:hypothetical protein
MGQIPALPRKVTKSNLQKLAWKKSSLPRGRGHRSTLQKPLQGVKGGFVFAMSTNLAQFFFGPEV